ncbi:MAG TPA: amino acid adenylation domain-containing protein [Longimicrobium sp.]
MTDLHDRLSALSPAKRALLERLRAGSPGADDIPPAPDGPAPLSFEQRRLWYLLQLAPDAPVYTIPLAFRLRGPLDAAALQWALGALVARHEPLRTAFRETGSEPVQLAGSADDFALEVEDLEDGDAEDAEAEARRRTAAFARRTFDLARGETFRAALLRVGKDDWRLLLGIHHLAGDGWSTALLLRELSALYAARAARRPADLPPLPLRFRDWAAWQWRREADPSADAAYWRERLAGAPHVLEVPPDRPRPAVQDWAGARHPFAVAPPLAGTLRALARREGTTLYAVLAAAWALVLGRSAGEEDFLLGTLLANRQRPELEALAGFFAATLPLRVRLDGDPTVRELVRRAHAAALGAQEHAGLSFDRIVELASVRRDPGRPPLVQSVLVLTDAASQALRLPGIDAEQESVDSGTCAFDLILMLEDRGGGGAVAADLLYATGLYEPATAGLLARHLTAVLERFAADPDRRISRVSLATEEEVRAAAAWNRTARPVPDLTLHQLFERQARATPERPAIVHGGESLSYAELNRRANRMAHALRGRGIGPEACVALLMERTPALVAAMLGVLKAGGAYTVLDPRAPAARHDAVLRAARARLVVVDAAWRARLAALPVEAAGVDAAALDGGRDDDPAPLATPANLAYLCFTSGSSGGPKGVEAEHRSVVAVLHHWAEMVGGPGTSLAAAPANFDFSVPELFGALCFGGTAVLVENALAGAPEGCAVDTACFVPTAAAERLRTGLPPGLKTAVVGGEAVLPSLVDELYRAGVRRVVNIYGPTETTVYCTAADLPPGTGRVTLGRPIANARAYVLDPALHPAGIGVPGELWIGGPGVARGYAARPGLTAESFLPDPWGPPGARMYRTRDLARWRGDGTLDFLGRRDAQVKVRGYRIELEEVEQALAAHPAVAAAAALPVSEGAGERRLAAWLVARGGERPEPEALRGFLRERLPEYMVPSTFAWTGALPRTPAGKLDRRALPAPGAVAVAVRHVGPRSPLEEKLAALWREVLGVERVGVHDDFFDLGGQSITATRLMSRIRAELGVQLPVAELLRGPTIEQVAWLVAGRQPREVRLPLVPLQPLGSRPPLFLGHPGGGHVVCYRTLAGLLAPEHPVYGLQARGIDDGRAPLGSVAEMAACYLEGVRRLQPHGPYHLGGWSYGGLLAWEMAQQLHAAGEEVALLAMLDTAAPDPDADRADALSHARILQRIVADLAGWAVAGLVKVEKIRHLPKREQALAAIRQARAPRTLPESRVDEVLQLTAVRSANLHALVGYRALPYRGHLTYFHTAGSARMHSPRLGPGYWSALAEGGATVHEVTGSHGTILHEPHVAAVAARLAAAIP